MAVTRIQMRGNCQCCGRLQAASGTVAQHGYEVKDGYFQGVCQGHRYAPMQLVREQADAVITTVRAEVVAMTQLVADLKSGKKHPAAIDTGRSERVNGKRIPVLIAWADADECQKKRAVEYAIYQTESRARSGTQFADGHEALTNRVHGTPLVEVKVEAPAARIEPGERRVLPTGKVATADYQDGAMVRYSYTNGDGKTFKTKMASRSWRALPQQTTQGE